MRDKIDLDSGYWLSGNDSRLPARLGQDLPLPHHLRDDSYYIAIFGCNRGDRFPNAMPKSACLLIVIFRQ
jgi:hypothetical protein